ncbi:hypothetical protein C6T65_17405 [Burkholderia vietnamiensis]|uniref:Uncharacterized protein n=1 Tax=Burkholderia vietnamiensis TaxID=60552 RepID=A0AA45BCP0_BURVI|nr:hypothetical protein C6T65_17405 [Burkholderia vietnamiensis]
MRWLRCLPPRMHSRWRLRRRSTQSPRPIARCSHPPSPRSPPPALPSHSSLQTSRWRSRSRLPA